MKPSLNDLLISGDAELVRIHDGIQHVRDTATGKVYKWLDGVVEELNEQKPVAPPAPTEDAIAKAQAIIQKRGLGGFFK